MEIKEIDTEKTERDTKAFWVAATLAFLLAAGFTISDALDYSAKHMKPSDKTSGVFSKRSSTDLKKLIENGTVAIKEFDWNGNYLGNVSYERFEESRWSDNPNHFEMTVLKGRNIDGVQVNGSVNGLTVTPYIVKTKESLTFEDLYGKSEIKQVISTNTIDKAIEEEKKEFRNYASIITYSDGTTAVLSGIVSEAGNFEEIHGCTLFSPNGEVTGIGVSENDVVNSYGNGLITWSDKRFPAYGAHKVLLLDGTFMEIMYTAYDTDNKNWDYSYNVSTGEKVHFHDGKIIGYTDADGNYSMPLDGFAITKCYDEEGDVVATKRYGSNEITWHDNKGEILMATAYDGSYCNVISKNSDGTHTLISKDMVTTYYDADNNIVAYDYPSGYHINVSGKKIDIYSNYDLVKTIVAGKGEYVSCEYDGKISIRSTKTNEELMVIYSKNIFSISKDGSIDLANLDEVLVNEGVMLSKKQNVDKFGRVTRFPGSEGHV